MLINSMRTHTDTHTLKLCVMRTQWLLQPSLLRVSVGERGKEREGGAFADEYEVAVKL